MVLNGFNDAQEQGMSQEKIYTQEQMDLALIGLELLKNNQAQLFKILERLESHQKWMLGIMGFGFVGLFGLMAHGFKWIY